uniref:GATA-type domain-containing protein n=1 Tax=Mycena chlorophos TaxID=658473 RepID=A0ABQ0LVL4_MYCCL|nr:predicted protein [Mycena chlorophos]
MRGEYLLRLQFRRSAFVSTTTDLDRPSIAQQNLSSLVSSNIPFYDPASRENAQSTTWNCPSTLNPIIDPRLTTFDAKEQPPSTHTQASLKPYPHFPWPPSPLLANPNPVVSPPPPPGSSLPHGTTGPVLAAGSLVDRQYGPRRSNDAGLPSHQSASTAVEQPSISINARGEAPTFPSSAQALHVPAQEGAEWLFTNQHGSRRAGSIRSRPVHSRPLRTHSAASSRSSSSTASSARYAPYRVENHRFPRLDAPYWTDRPSADNHQRAVGFGDLGTSDWSVSGRAAAIETTRSADGPPVFQSQSVGEAPPPSEFLFANPTFPPTPLTTHESLPAVGVPSAYHQGGGGSGYPNAPVADNFFGQWTNTPQASGPSFLGHGGDQRIASSGQRAGMPFPRGVGRAPTTLAGVASGPTAFGQGQISNLSWENMRFPMDLVGSGPVTNFQPSSASRASTERNLYGPIVQSAYTRYDGTPINRAALARETVDPEFAPFNASTLRTVGAMQPPPQHAESQFAPETYHPPPNRLVRVDHNATSVEANTSFHPDFASRRFGPQHVPASCPNCGNPDMRNYRRGVISGQIVCNACGQYEATKKKLRPRYLEDRKQQKLRQQNKRGDFIDSS